MCTKYVEHGFHRVFEPANHKIINMVKNKNVGHKAFCGRHQKNNVKPYRGMTEYEFERLRLARLSIILSFVERLIGRLVPFLFYL